MGGTQVGLQLHISTAAYVVLGVFISVLTVFRNSSCSNGMMLSCISSFYIYVSGRVCVCVVCVHIYIEHVLYVVVYLCVCIFFYPSSPSFGKGSLS